MEKRLEYDLQKILNQNIDASKKSLKKNIAKNFQEHICV